MPKDAFLLPLAEWPLSDREAWERACAPAGDIWDEGGHALERRPRTCRNYEGAYGRWMSYLRATGQLRMDEALGARVTPVRLNAWVKDLQAAKLKSSTIHQYLMSLHSILRLLDPEWHGEWLRRPGGRPLGSFFPCRPRRILPVDLNKLMRKVRALHREGKREGVSGHRRRQALRDAAFMAMMLCYAPRVSDAAGMEVGTHLTIKPDGSTTVLFPADTTKGKRDVTYALAQECKTLILDYYRLARADWPGVEGTTRLWLGLHREPLDSVGATGVFRRRTLEWTGTAYGPHAARHWLRDNAAKVSPQAAADAAVVMGHSLETARRHYARSSDRHAVGRYGALVARLLEQG